jgi:SAM-dependent methyltransferase
VQTYDVLPQRYNAIENERNLQSYGEGHRAVGYKSEREAYERYETMLAVVRELGEPTTLLDVGCGLAHLLDHAEAVGGRALRYTGIEVSSAFLDLARARRPDADLRMLDLLDEGADLETFDYVVLNHLFNWRGEIAFDEWLDYWRRMLLTAWPHCRRGIAFNVMSTIVDWERDDLFHLSFDAMAAFVSGNLSRYFVIRHDYPAYEYTVYVYRAPRP